MSSFIPYVVEQSGRGERSYDIFSRLLNDRIIMLCDQVTDASASVVIAQLPLMFGIIGEFSNWLFGFVNAYNTMMDSNVMICDLREMLDLEDDFKHGTGIEPDVTKYPPEIEFRNVSFWYENEEEKILDHVNLHIRAGEKLALVGNNGA